MTSTSSDEADRFMPDPGRDGLLVMTFNLRYAAAHDGHPWRDRLPVMAELIGRERPDVLGTQEGLIDQLEELADALPEEYSWTGEGRMGGNDDEFTAVFFNELRVDAIEADNFWLSATPDVPGSKNWGSSLPRMATRVRFAVRSSRPGRPAEFTLINTHFDHRSPTARLRGAHMIRSRAETETRPVVVCGDFNAPAGSVEYEAIAAAPSPLVDAWTRARETIGPDCGTFHGYGPAVIGGDRIDWLLTTPDVVIDVAGVNTFAKGGIHPSDHFPVEAIMRLPGPAGTV